jgi:hypothetical protein
MARPVRAIHFSPDLEYRPSHVTPFQRIKSPTTDIDEYVSYLHVTSLVYSARLGSRGWLWIGMNVVRTSASRLVMRRGQQFESARRLTLCCVRLGISVGMCIDRSTRGVS